MNRYVILSARTTEALEQQVNELLTDDWKVHGSLVYAQAKHPREENSVLQPMVKFEFKAPQ